MAPMTSQRSSLGGVSATARAFSQRACACRGSGAPDFAAAIGHSGYRTACFQFVLKPTGGSNFSAVRYERESHPTRTWTSFCLNRPCSTSCWIRLKACGPQNSLPTWWGWLKAAGPQISPFSIDGGRHAGARGGQD